MTIELHRGDLPAGLKLGPVVAVDTETMGLNPARDRLCLVQLSQGDGICHLVQIPRPSSGQRVSAPNLKALLEDKSVLKLFHFARFDLSALKVNLDVDCAPVYCTKFAAKLV
ncbi:MAG TPA: ribonuclease H-like domain-containing protein, partial [Dongiaceae bacterium]